MWAFSHPDSFIRLALGKPTPNGPGHDWYISQWYFSNTFFPNKRFCIIFWINFDPGIDKIKFDIALIIEIPQPADHRIDLDDRLI